MDIAGLSIATSQTTVMNQVSTAVLSQSLDTLETMGEGMVQMMEQSVNPNVGSNVDIRL